MPGGEIDFDHFAAVDMRVGRVTEVDDFPEARKPAWKLTIDFGPELGTKRSSAQIIEYNEQQGTLPGFVEGFTNVARDEHRHVAFGARFLRDMVQRDERHLSAIQRTLAEVGIFETTDIQERLDASWEHTTMQFEVLFDQLLKQRTDRLAVEPEDLETMVEAVTIYHMVVEGMLALTGQHFIIQYNEQEGTLPGFVEGFTNVARDEHRHVAFGARFLRGMVGRDPRYQDAITRTLGEVLPVADGVLRPKFRDPADDDVPFFGTSVTEARAFAAKALERRMKVIGLLQAA